MRTRVLLSMWFAASCTALSAQVRLKHPDQFYTNGENVSGWTMNAENHLQSSLWFAKNPTDSLSYRQMIAIIYDSQPDKIYYVDSVTKLFVGRFDLNTEQYSMLPNDARKTRRAEIEESTFPPPGDIPSVAEMFDPLSDDASSNRNQMMLPPPTLQFPRLNKSSWDSSYMTANRDRIKAQLNFEGNSGKYQLQGSNVEGRLSGVQYNRNGDGYTIQGNWTLGNANGYVRFNIEGDNLGIFWGEWGFQGRGIEAAWDGVRRP